MVEEVALTQSVEFRFGAAVLIDYHNSVDLLP